MRLTALAAWAEPAAAARPEPAAKALPVPAEPVVGGSNTVDAGTFDMSNHMDGAAAAAAGVTVMAQNSGVGSLIQQSVNVQANLNIGP